jgi:hypothetical protein
MKKKMETSKKLAWFSGICFVIVILYSIFIFTYSAITDRECDFAMLITLITITGGVFGVTMATYSNKSRYENVVKIQQGYVKEKYTILNEMGILDRDRAIQEIEEEFFDIEADFDNEKSNINQEINYNE